MPITPRKVRLVFGPLESQDPTTKALTFPTSAQIYLSDKSTVATIYSNTTGTALTNSPGIPTGVATGAPGLDAYGNIVFYGDPGTDYFALVSSLFLPVPVTGIHGTDFTDHLGITGSVADPHGDRAYADTHKVDVTTLGVAGGTATLDSAGCIPANQWVFD
jgi:hypothetical protein